MLKTEQTTTEAESSGKSSSGAQQQNRIKSQNIMIYLNKVIYLSFKQSTAVLN